MTHTKTIYSPRYDVLDIESISSVRARVAAIEAHLPPPRTESEARVRTIDGLYAVRKMSCLLTEQLDEDAEFVVGKDGYERVATAHERLLYWTKMCSDIESRFQGNINSLLLFKRFHQQRMMKACGHK